MTFNSITFFVFLAVVVAAHWSVPPRSRNGVLLVASYVFYGWWDWRFLSLIVISTIADYFLGRTIHAHQDHRVRTRLLWTSVTINLGILAVFKYYDFFVDSVGDALSGIGLDTDAGTLGLLLPVGISFYTFQTISYSFDIYRGRVQPAPDFLTFAAYVAYFPQLVAGPIERAQRLLPQIADQDRHFPDAATRSDAYRLIIMGLVKKVVLADGVAPIVNEAFSDASTTSWLALIGGVLGFAVQIYGDFSGYSDIARGVSKLFGIDLVVNFRQPYLSRNITEFWRRWHISLSDWLRDYLYIPLGGNRHSQLITYRNLMLTMLLGGLWHGASWNFVVWGGLHGLLLAGHRLLRGGRVSSTPVGTRDIPAILATNVAVLVAWIFFRAGTFSESVDVLVGMVTLQNGSFDLIDFVTVIGFVVATLAIDLVERTPRGASTDSSPLRAGVGLGLAIVALVTFSGGTPVPFLYFQF